MAAESENIYVAGGLGITLSVFDRFTLNIEGRNTSYTQNAIRNIVPQEELDDFNLTSSDFGDDRLYNWSLGLGLEFHIGGRRPGTLSDLDREYQKTFSSGFRGASILFEPTLTRVNWDDAMPYVDTYLGGVSAGVDFGPLVGARLFYYRSMEDEEINFDFDDLSMYGADFRFRLSAVTAGVSPFLTIGGGYIDVQDDYRNRSDGFGAPSQGFATGGGGLSLNLSPNFRLTGTYRALLTSSSDVEDIDDTDQIRTSNQWSVGVNLAFGNRARRPDAVYTSTAASRLDAQRAEDQIRMQAALADQARENKKATNQLRDDYELKMMDLEDELDQAKVNRDTARIAELEEELEETEEVVEELEDRSDEYDDVITKARRDSMDIRKDQVNALSVAPAPAPARNIRTANVQTQGTAGQGASVGNGRINLSPAELENLIEEIFEGINEGLQNPMMMPPPTMGNPSMMLGQGMMTDTATMNQSQREMDDLRSSIADLREDSRKAREADKATLRKEMTQNTDTILKEIREMREELSTKAAMSDRELRRLDRETEEAVEPQEETRKERRERRRREREEEGGNK